ncbi:MAG: hypothetical protein WCY30_00210 [Candidatus Neomarinimicrobiota bacterium]|jgi:hypothetical protein
MKVKVLAELGGDGYTYLVIPDGHQGATAYPIGKHIAGGMVQLNSNKKVDAELMPYTALKYKGVLDASEEAYPENPVEGDVYVISVAGTIEGTDYTAGDLAVYNGTDWDKVEGAMTATEILGLLTAAGYNLDNVFPTIDLSLIPYTALKYAGALDASGGTYPVEPGDGDVYIISTGGTIDAVTYESGDLAIYDGTDWHKVESGTSSTRILETLSATGYDLNGVFPTLEAAEDIAANLIAKPNGAGGVVVGTEECLIVGVNNTGDIVSSAEEGIFIKGKCNVEAGEHDILGGTEIICGYNGRVIDFKSEIVNLMSAVQGTINDDFTTGQLTGSEAIKLTTTSGDDDTKEVTLYGIVAGEVVTETIAVAVAAPVSTIRTDWEELIAVYVAAGFVGDLTISDQDDNAIIALTTPSNTTYGAVECDDTTDAYGHLVKITAGGATSGVVVISGTDGADSAKYEILDFSEETIMNALTGFKTITHLLIGADEEAEQTYSIEIPANVRAAGYTLNAIASGEVGAAVLY